MLNTEILIWPVGDFAAAREALAVDLVEAIAAGCYVLGCADIDFIVLN